MDITKLDFEKGDGLIPVIVQDSGSFRVLTLGYMNRESLQKTLDEKKLTFYSRSEKRLRTPREITGNALRMVNIQADCDNDALLVLAKPEGPACHTGETSCFHEKEFSPYGNKLDFLLELETLLKKRKTDLPEGSYTTYLFEKGLDKIAQKMGEEAVETVIEAKNDKKKKFTGEVADLLFHLMVLMVEKGVSLKKVATRLEKRHAKGDHKHFEE